MNEFTGDYYVCEKCTHIYDYNDLCPECGSGSDQISASDIRVSINAIGEEKERLEKMLESHGDLKV